MKIKLKITFLILALASSVIAQKTPPIEAKAPLKTWFDSSMKGQTPQILEATIAPTEIKTTRKQVFQAYKNAAIANEWDKKFLKPNVIANKKGKINIKSAKYDIKEGLTMPYLALQKGDRPANGWPLTIAMHGGGSTGNKLPHPHAWSVNSREWNSQIRLALGLYPSDQIYFIPRMVDDNQGRWWKEFNHTAFSAMIRHAILFWDVDPNRVYMLGISEGGYGTEALACRYPDKLAAANGMACGSGTSIHIENLRNLPFRTDVGENDTMFGRRPNAQKKHALLDKFRMKNPGDYLNHLEVQKGRGHGINYSEGPKWMIKHVRNPHPERITYTLFQHDKTKNKGAYWLQATNDLEKKVIYLDAQIDKEKNTINIKADATINDEIVQSADWQKPLADQGETKTASGLKLRIWLHETMLDLSKPVIISINGKEAKTVTPKLQLKTMCESLMQFGDPNYTYPSKVDVLVP